MAFDCRLEEEKLAPLSSVGSKQRGRGTVHSESQTLWRATGASVVKYPTIIPVITERSLIMVDGGHVSAQMCAGSAAPQLSQLNLQSPMISHLFFAALPRQSLLALILNSPNSLERKV